MLAILFAVIVFAFLVLGAVVFLVCILVPPARKFALSAALWCAMWGPCSICWMTLAGLGLIARAFWTKNGDVTFFHTPTMAASFGWAYLIAGVLMTITVATTTALLHQALIRRFTFPLFRLYATAVIAGIGSVFGWCLSWWFMSLEVPHHMALPLELSVMLLLVFGFGIAAYKGARSLRGSPPSKLTWITPEEFAGP